jgi:hypothetical protein
MLSPSALLRINSAKHTAAVSEPFGRSRTLLRVTILVLEKTMGLDTWHLIPDTQLWYP